MGSREYLLARAGENLLTGPGANLLAGSGENLLQETESKGGELNVELVGGG